MTRKINPKNLDMQRRSGDQVYRSHSLFTIVCVVLIESRLSSVICTIMHIIFLRVGLQEPDDITDDDNHVLAMNSLTTSQKNSGEVP